jgi:large subunit ribosomal protein L15
MRSKHPEKKRRKCIGRGAGTGHGKTSTRGGKGQTARSGGKVRPGFEGGQNPLYRRLPKRGFSNAFFHRHYQLLNIGDFEKLGMAEISPEKLSAQGLLKRNFPLKVLGDGTLKRPYVVKAHKFSGSAKAKIEAAGGRAELLKP